MKHVKYIAAGIALALLATGCSSNPFRNEKKQAQEAADRAQRVPLITLDGELSVDPEMASISVFLPDAVLRNDWPQAGGASDNAAGHLVGAAEFKVDWKVGAGASSTRHKRLVSPPVVANGKLYLLDAAQTVRAFDALTGKALWHVKLEPPRKRDRIAVGGGVAVAGDRLIVTSGYGYVSALSVDDGAVIWKRQAQTPVTGAPTLDDANAYITSSNNELFVVSLATGEILWSDQAIAESARVLSSPGPAVGEDLVVAPFSSGEVIAYLPANGRRVWTDSLTRGGQFTPISAINDIAGRPVISEGLVFAASQSGVLAGIDALSGSRRWSQPFGSIQTPAVAGQFIFAVNTDGLVACFDKNDGAVIWVHQLERFKNEKKRKNRIVWTGPVIASGKIILASSEGHVVALSPQSGEELDEMKIGGPVYIEPIVANERVYLLTDEARLVAIK